MDTSAALIHVQTMMKVLKSPIYSEIESLLDDESELVTLKKKTMPMVKEVLQKAEKQEMLQPDDCRMLQISIEGLTEAVFEADNLFDEITTLVQSKKLMDCNTEVRPFLPRFFVFLKGFLPRFNLANHTFITSCQKVGRILDGIKRDHPELWSMKMVKTEVQKENPRETHSFVSEKEDIFGRENDKRIVLDMLLDSSVQEAVSVISIVGIGGLGKTTLAQLVYNDEEIIAPALFQLRMWVCVSQDFNVKVLLRQLLAAATNQAVDSSLSLDQLLTKLREKLNGKKFLLVLDDVWNEESDNWKKLEIILKQGARGSRVIVTTRSEKVASVVGSHRTTHKLGALSDEDSWKLFERMTLEPEQLHLETRFIEIGKKIVCKCANVPLAIRVAGSLLKGNPEEIWWEYLENMHLLANMKDGENDILNVLKVSYHYLPTHLKCCFTYCAVYPKDDRIEKEQLIQLWMAQGYILPSNGQSFEVLGERYFTVLLQRCFFQDVEKDDDDEIISCKMHDLIHDLAEEVAGSAINSSHDHRNSLGDKTLHLSLMEDDHDSDPPPNMKSLRTITLSTNPPSFTYVDNIDKFADWLDMKYLRRLRVLDWKVCFPSELSSMIGELLHLRYLDLSGNKKLNLLPDSITQLYNLQTLKLVECRSLEELPRNLNKLVNLRHLDIISCDSLTHMPPGMNTMTNLHKLTKFLVGKIGSGRLGDIQCLNHLRGSIEIQIGSGLTSYDATEVREGRYLINKPHLRDVKISWNEECEEGKNAEAWLQGLQPHSNLRKFRLKNYPGASFPNWVESSMNLNNCLPHLVKLKLFKCRWLDHLPLVSQMLHLKVLKIYRLSKLEYMESNTSSSSSSRRSSSSSERATAQSGGSSQEEELVFFPSLEELELEWMFELKGWWETPSHLVLFPRLSVLKIYFCPKLTSVPFCSREVVIDDVGFLNCQPKEAFQHLSILDISGDSKIERLTTGEVGELFQSGCLSSLRQLEFYKCSKLKSISGRGVWEQFTALESLSLRCLEKMEMEEEEEDVNAGIEVHVPWKCLALTLRTLAIIKLPKVVRLPKGMQQLTALQFLRIQECHNLEELPAWIGCLPAWDCPGIKSLPKEVRHLKYLTRLSLEDCSRKLKERCQQPTGADWPKIQHIPHIYVS